MRANQNVVVDALRDNADVLVKARSAVHAAAEGGGMSSRCPTLVLYRDGLEVDCAAYPSLNTLGGHSDSIRRPPHGEGG